MKSQISAIAMFDKYWMVHGSGPTTIKHMTKDNALKEAARLANLHPTQEFTVLEAVSVLKVSNPPVIQYDF